MEPHIKSHVSKDALREKYIRASTTDRRGRRFASGGAKYVFAERLQDGEREQPALPSSTASSPFPQDVDGSRHRCTTTRCCSVLAAGSGERANPFGGKASRLPPNSNSIYPIPRPQSS